MSNNNNNIGKLAKRKLKEQSQFKPDPNQPVIKSVIVVKQQKVKNQDTSSKGVQKGKEKKDQVALGNKHMIKKHEPPTHPDTTPCKKLNLEGKSKETSMEGTNLIVNLNQKENKQEVYMTDAKSSNNKNNKEQNVTGDNIATGDNKGPDDTSDSSNSGSKKVLLSPELLYL